MPNDQPQPARALQKQPELPPVPELRYAEEPSEERFGPRVMSEYERQKRAYRGQLRREGFWRLLRWMAVMAVLVTAGCAAFALYLSTLERKLDVARPKLVELKADRAALKARLDAARHGRGQEIDKLKAMRKLLNDKTFKQLEGRYLGASDVRRGVEISARLDDQVLSAEKPKRGTAKQDEAEEARAAGARGMRADLLERIGKGAEKRDSVISNAVEHAGGILSVIDMRIDAIREVEQKLQEATEIRRNALSWLFPCE